MKKPNQNNILTGKTALVTGGALRIGRAICLALAAQGADVVVHYRTSKHEAETLCYELRQLGVKSWPVTSDFNKAGSAELLVGKACKLAGKLDIVINNASEYQSDTLSTVAWPGFSAAMQVNAWSPFVIGREFAKQCVGGGDIINLLDSRITGGGDPTHAAYLVSKHALAALTSMMALEFAPAIKVNAVAPGLVLPPPGLSAAALKKLSMKLPLKRHGGPHDVAQAVLFLLQSTFITGQVIYVDGGRNTRESMK
jgi:NAD(P)-dependent dehydrogenase (short-subunit alcohol dehydrogenase family)